MNETYAGMPPLTAEQQAVVDQPPDALTLVTAGAGSGKTHTLVRRLDQLVASGELSAGEILVLTFSRAAVRELKSRLARNGDAARHVRAQTFDSWALDLLAQVDANGDWHNRSFEARIAGARQAIDNELADELYEHLGHVVIDEVQDLVGDRRELVEGLLDRFACGFTVVGDPAQSIYGFTVSEPADRQGEANRFFDWLRVTFGEDLVELHLTENFRARHEEAKAALEYGRPLQTLTEGGAANGEGLYAALRSTLRSCLNLGRLDEFTADSLASCPGTAAVLCKTNGEALLISQQLHHLGVPHRLQRSAQDRVVPAWIGQLIRRCDGSTLSRARYDELCSELSLPDGAGPDQLWRLLLRTGSGRGNDRSLDVGRLRVALAVSRLPDELMAQPPSPVVVSSFHRAKGLEFDRVVVVDPGPLPTARAKANEDRTPWELDPAEEARSLYVAMTRPRDELQWLDALDTRLIHVDKRSGRWGRYFYQHWRRDGMEITGRDVHSDHPAGMRDFTGNPVELQEYLWSKVRPGDEVVLERLAVEAAGRNESPPYLIMHDGNPIGTVSDHFRSHLYRHLQSSKNFVPRNWPRSISGIRIDSVETVAGSEAAGVQSGLGVHGVWSAPRLVGLSTFTWDKKPQEEDFGGTAH
ncbi:UvrD-helicase domain-containing protein [Nonomuraea sp. NPDC001684]